MIKVDKPNMAQKGTISVEKTGEVFFGVNVSGEEDKDVIYQPVYKVKGLAGAVYEITADEDVITPDGTLRYHKGDVVDTVTTDEDGTAKSKELYLGKYTVVETKAPTGMVINKEKHSVELTYAGQDVAVTETATSFVNERQKVKISLEKILEQDETFGIGKNDEIKNISFGLYAKEDVVSSSGTVIPADGLIEIITLDENGAATANTDLPFGSYYVKEIATDEHYILSDTQYPFTFEYAGQNTETVEIKVNDGKPIENKLIYGSVSGKKIDENGEALGGALIGIFKADETEFTKEHAIMTATSEKDGSFSFAKVPYGQWIVRLADVGTEWFEEADNAFKQTPDLTGCTSATMEALLENAERSDMVVTNIGKVPIEEYREIVAVQNGFDSYDEMYNEGIRIGNGYDKEPEPIVPAWEKKKKEKVKSFDLHPDVPMAERNNFDLSSNPVEQVGKKERFHRNMEAIKVLKECEFENRFATPEEQLILSKYVGWGGLSEAFDENNSAWADEFVELYTALSPEEYAAARESTLTAFYTPPEVTDAIYKAMEQMGFKEGNLLDKTTPRLIQFHTFKNAVNPPFLGGFSIFSTVAAWAERHPCQ